MSSFYDRPALNLPLVEDDVARRRPDAARADPARRAKMRKNVRRLPARLVAAAAAAAVAGGLTATAQQRSGVEPVPRTPYAAPRTPWGHPDLQGTYSNDDETGTPMERPAAFEGRTHDSLTPAE